MGTQETSLLAKGWQLFVVAMIGYFVVSFITSLVRLEVVSTMQANENEQR